MSAPQATATGENAAVDPRRWWALVVIAAATLMVVLDTSIINLALPKAQAALGMSDATRGWVVTAYTLTFGGLLLLGGRVADLLGRRRVFLIGLIGFAAAPRRCGEGMTAMTRWNGAHEPRPPAARCTQQATHRCQNPAEYRCDSQNNTGQGANAWSGVPYAPPGDVVSVKGPHVSDSRAPSCPAPCTSIRACCSPANREVARVLMGWSSYGTVSPTPGLE